MVRDSLQTKGRRHRGREGYVGLFPPLAAAGDDAEEAKAPFVLKPEGQQAC